MTFQLQLPAEFDITPDYMIDLPNGFKAEVFKDPGKQHQFFVRILNPDGMTACTPAENNPIRCENALAVRMLLHDWVHTLTHDHNQDPDSPEAILSSMMREQSREH